MRESRIVATHNVEGFTKSMAHHLNGALMLYSLSGEALILMCHNQVECNNV